MMQNETADVGYLSVAVGTANKAYPLPGVRVEVYLENETGDVVLLRTLLTNESGIAEPLAIPTPPAANSLTPDAAEENEDTGDTENIKTNVAVRIRLFRDGYYPVEAISVPVFGGVRSLQYFDMIPIAKSGQFAPPTGELIFVETADTALTQDPQ